MPEQQTTQTTTQQVMPSNPDVNPTLSALLKGVQSEYAAAPKGFYVNKPLYAGTGAATDNALSSMLSGANDPMYSGAFRDTFSDMADTAAGNKFGMDDPGYAALRSKLGNDVTTANLSAFNNSGLFGSDSNRQQLTDDLAGALGGLDYQNFQNDIARQERAQAGLAGAFQNTGLPASRALQVGQLMDQDAQAALMADADLQQRRFNAPTDYLAKLSSILTGNAQAGGTSSSTTSPVTQPNPLQLLLGGALGIGSLLL